MDDGPLGFAVFVSAAALIAAYLFTDAFAGVSFVLLLIWAALWMVAGVLWSMKEWYDYLVERRDELKERFDSLSEKEKQNETNKTWVSYFTYYKPTAADNKQQIVTWMTLWPLFFAGWVLTWPRRMFVWIYNKLSTVYDSIAERVFERA